jgi:uncharacterized protein (TIGR02147 family)
MINLFGYFDYRKFLSDFLAEKLEPQPSPSSRNLALQAGIDPSYFAKVVKGVRNLTPEQSLRIATALRFDAAQTEYFEILVGFNQARGHDAKRLYFERLLEYNKAPDAALLTKEQYRYYTQWYHVVIREVLHFFPQPIDYLFIAKKLIPPIAPDKVREAIVLLENLAMIRRNADGGWELSENFVTAGPEVQSFAIRNFQLSMMDMAKSALEKFPKEKREISALTLSLSEEGFGEAMKEIAASKKRLMQIAHNDGNVSAVYQFNFQAFPVTDTFPRNEDDDQ